MTDQGHGVSAELAHALFEIEKWKQASGLVLGGDPDAVTPEHLEVYLGQLCSIATGRSLPTVHLAVSSYGQSAEAHGEGWDIVASYEVDYTASLMVSLEGQIVAEVTVHLPRQREMEGHTIIDEAQGIGAALLWSAMRAQQLRSLPEEEP